MEWLFEYASIPYIISTVLLTWLILKYFIKKPISKIKFIVSASVGFLLGILWYFQFNVDLQILIVSYLASVGFYELIKKFITKKIGDYDNNKGVI